VRENEQKWLSENEVKWLRNNEGRWLGTGRPSTTPLEPSRDECDGKRTGDSSVCPNQEKWGREYRGGTTIKVGGGGNGQRKGGGSKSKRGEGRRRW